MESSPTMNTIPNTEDRIWSILSHLSSLAFGMGIVLPIVGWSDQRRKSNYAAFQNLQALGYQSLGFTIWILSYLVLLVVAAIILLAMPASEGSRGSEITIPAAWLNTFYFVTVGFLALYMLLPVVAAVACALGRDFRYPVMGNRLARYLNYDPIPRSEGPVWLYEDHEFRWVAAAGHFSILVLLWGMVAPLTAWLLYDKRSFFLKFQSIQALVYQAGATALLGTGGFLYVIGLVALIISMGGIGQPDSNSSSSIIGIVISGVLLLLGTLILLFVPLLHILGQWAGYRVLKGDEYCYPLIGRLVDRWIAKTSKRD